MDILLYLADKLLDFVLVLVSSIIVYNITKKLDNKDRKKNKRKK